MGGHAKCYDHTQDVLSEVLSIARVEHMRDGVLTCGEQLVEAMLAEAQKSARMTATFVRVGIRFLGGGSMDEGLMGQVRDCERAVQEASKPPPAITARLVRKRKATLRVSQSGERPQRKL